MNEQATTDKLVADMKVVMTDAEDLLRATASAGASGGTEMTLRVMMSPTFIAFSRWMLGTGKQPSAAATHAALRKIKLWARMGAPERGKDPAGRRGA